MGSRKAVHPWDQLDGEPAKAYSLFLKYRELGIERTLKKAAEITGYAEGTVEQLSAHFKWIHRADQWDEWSLRIKSQAAEARVVKEADLEAKTVSDLVKMTRVLVARVKKKVMDDKALQPTVSGVAALADTVVKLSRLQRGEVTDRRETVAKQARERVGKKIERAAKMIQESLRESSGGDQA